MSDGLAYPYNGDSFDGVFEADELVFGVPGHDGLIDLWDCSMIE